MTFSEPIFIRLGLAVVLLVLLGLWSNTRRRRLLAEFFGGRRAATRISRSDLYRAPLERLVLLVLAVMAVAAAAADPSWIIAEPPPAPPPAPAPQVMVAIDVSVSMQATDVEPTRLARATSMAEELLTNLEDSHVGLLIFAGEAYPLTPPTPDHGVFRYLLAGVSPTIASAHDPGTLMSRGISGAVDLFDIGIDSLAAGQRSIVIIGDGDAGDTDAEVVAAVREATDKGITIHTIGVGTTAGSPLLMPAAEFQLAGPIVDDAGNPVISRYREAALRDIAEAGGGAYARADDFTELRELMAALTTPPTATAAGEIDGIDSLRSRLDPAFLFIAAALAFLLLESFLDIRFPGHSLVRRRRVA